MGVLLFPPIPQVISVSSSSASSSTLSFSSIPIPIPIPSSRLENRITSSRFLNGVQIRTPFMVKERGSVIVKASAEVDGTGSDAPEIPSKSKEESVPVENLPLESKLQLKLEQKTRMKLAKKIRLRRKRLVRKRQLRKKGRWPPSKMKKNKNV